MHHSVVFNTVCWCVTHFDFIVTKYVVSVNPYVTQYKK